jgi:uncharacterized protein
VDRSHAQALSGGAHEVAPAFDVPGVGRMSYLADPTGGMFALFKGAR